MLLGIRKLFFKKGEVVTGQFFKESNPIVDFPFQWKEKIIKRANGILEGRMTYFSFHEYQQSTPPNWFYNPFDNYFHSQSDKHWTEISDFGEGDIKIVWELSRFDWITDLARAYKIEGNKKYLDTINLWLENWSENNPLNQGPNWKCGQEASFRLMKLLTAAFMLDQLENPKDELKTLIYDHVSRIEGNIYYGISQDNNHGSSEAIGLYIGAAWLIRCGDTRYKLTKWKNKGRRLLENRLIRLIQKQGSFSQRSMTYHRVMVDTMSFCLHFIQLLKEPELNQEIKKRLIALGEWQYKMIFGENGDAPNFGSNDGARVENLYTCDYRDFRPSIQLFFALLTNERVYNNIDISEAMFWRCKNISLKYPIRKIDLPKGEILDNHIIIVRNERAKIFVKIPDDTFRPGNDSFHMDIWVDGRPLLIDSGTYSYNAGEITEYFKSVKSHNTIQFGENEQMPKISKFLNGAWLKPKKISEIDIGDDEITWNGSYTDYKKNEHSRKFILSEGALKVIDSVESKLNVTSRWHFYDNIDLGKYENFTQAESSLYYFEKHNIKTLEIQYDSRNSLISIFEFDNTTNIKLELIEKISI